MISVGHVIAEEYFWKIVFALAIGTFAIRASVIAVSSRIRLSDRVREAFSFIPAAVLPAMAVPMVFYHQGHQEWLLGKERFVILLLATGVAVYSRKMTVTLVFGLVALYVMSRL